MLTKYRNFAVRLLGWVPDKYPDILRPVASTLPKSGIRIPPKNYVSAVCLTAFIGYIVTLITLSALVLTVLKLNIFLTTFFIVFIPLLVAVIIFIVGMFYPYQMVLSRRKSIETNLPFAISHMGSIASSGIPPQAIFKLLSEFKEYDVLADEMQKITRNIEVFGLDPMSALKEVSKRTPSDKFKQLLQGLITTMEGGGDLKTYLKNAGEQSLFTWRMKRQKYLQQLSTYAEFYTGILIASPLFLISLFSIMNMIQPQLGGFDILQLMKISVYLIIPTLNLGFLLFLHMTQVEM
ncbi:MAG: type II secretion system F family protein [Candidatus Aenigmarchaeota archaeon]|nr:type II secretion system F family protein [Candidatus Aenigmarchaeota archaeon]